MASVETSECDIIATLSPRSGKLDRVVELLTNLTEVVRNMEPGVLSYRLYKDFDQATGNEELILVEKLVQSKTVRHAYNNKVTRYRDKAAYDFHAEVPEFKAMHIRYKEEELMQKPIIIKSVKPIRGFDR